MRVYFHLSDGTDEMRDPDGVEVSDIERARALAVTAVRELRDEDRLSARDWSAWTLTMTDASGAVLLSLPLATFL